MSDPRGRGPAAAAPHAPPPAPAPPARKKGERLLHLAGLATARRARLGLGLAAAAASGCHTKVLGYAGGLSNCCPVSVSALSRQDMTVDLSRALATVAASTGLLYTPTTAPKKLTMYTFMVGAGVLGEMAKKARLQQQQQERGAAADGALPQRRMRHEFSPVVRQR